MLRLAAGLALGRLTIQSAFRNKKVGENAWYALYYVAVVTFALLKLSPTTQTHDLCLVPDEDWEAPPLFDLYYRLQTAFYAQALVAILLLDRRRKDLRMMVFHHVVTLSLLLGSDAAGHRLIGFHVVLVHDISDIFLYAATALHAAGKGWTAVVCFGLFYVSFAALRLFVYPAMLIWPCRMAYPGRLLHHHVLLYAGMIALLPLHIYWFWMATRMLIKTAREGPGAKDIRD